MILAPQFGIVRWDSPAKSDRLARMCESKVRYSGKKLALAARHGDVPLRAYECPACQGWHLTKRRAG